MSSNLNFDRIIAVRTTKTVYRDDDKAIKVFNTNYSKVDVLNEALNQARVETTGLNVPKIIEVTHTVNGEWVIVYEYVEGKTLQQLMDENPEKKPEYLETFVKLQMEVNSKKCKLLSRLKDKLDTKISNAQLDATTRYELRTRLEGTKRENQLCHGDFNPSNVVVKEDGTMYILDWAHATQGSPCADAARTYLTFWLNGDIKGADDYLEVYCKLANVSKKDVQKWLPIVAASQTALGKENEREFLLSWINVSEYE